MILPFIVFPALQIAIGIALVVTGLKLVRAIAAQRREALLRGLLTTFAPVAASAQDDPRTLLGWYPIAMASRRLFPEAFQELDAASGAPFPITQEHLQTAHARCTTDWLAWEHSQDVEYALKVAGLEDEIVRAGGQASPLLRTRLAALEREKLERYQQRYQTYVECSKALKALMEQPR